MKCNLGGKKVSRENESKNYRAFKWEEKENHKGWLCKGSQRRQCRENQCHAAVIKMKSHRCLFIIVIDYFWLLHLINWNQLHTCFKARKCKAWQWKWSYNYDSKQRKKKQQWKLLSPFCQLWEGNGYTVVFGRGQSLSPLFMTCWNNLPFGDKFGQQGWCSCKWITATLHCNRMFLMSQEVNRVIWA